MWRSLFLIGAVLATSGECLAQPAKTAPPARLRFVKDLAAARKQAAAAGKPLLVLSVLGDCTKHC
jgi:hypothetical protein